MATPSPTPFLRIRVFSNGSYSVMRATSLDVLFRVRTDQELGREDRAVDGNPMVFFLRDTTCPITREHQWYLRAANPGMSDHNVAALMDNTKAFCNRTGIWGNIVRQNWIEMEGLDPRNPLPAWSKVYICGGEICQVINGVVTVMDGSALPPLKDGLSWATMTRDQAMDITNYKYSPQKDPHLFYAAKNTHDDGTPVPFPHGATYSWYKNGLVPVTFIPLVANLRDGPVFYPPNVFSENSAQLTPL